MASSERPTFRSSMFVAIENERGEYLLQRRANTDFLDGYYDLASGHLEYDESCETCAVRETEEEFGITVDPANLELLATFQSDFEPGIKYLNLIYRARTFTGEPRIGEPDKIDHIGWFHPDNFPEKLTIGVRVFLMTRGADAVRNYYIGPDEYKSMMGESYV